ncbi:MAG: bifunctional UDP-N-acetylglucosamine diphosphorylase/glucosamine-1-phosphate N-acetyltransferase GlmU [Hyphomicrobiaceae bacterium]
MTNGSLLSVILAAGEGTRMKSARPKPLHCVAGRSLLGHAMASAKSDGDGHFAVVVGPNMDDVRDEVAKADPSASIYVQETRNGTADAVLAARPAIAAHDGDVIVLFCDTALLQAETIARLRAALDQGANIAVLGFEAADPTGYGRLLTDPDGSLIAIREHRDASPDEQKVRLCNSGIMAFRCPDLLALLGEISNDNAKSEFYLTDIVEIGRRQGLRCVAVSGPEAELLGVNDRSELATVEALFQQRLRAAAMANGATLIAPETVWFNFDTVTGRDVVIEPNVFFGPGVVVEDNVTILANCHIEGARLGSGARVGPFARVRPKTELGAGARVGNFVEVKNVTMAAGAKANHLAYLGDGSVGTAANVGAGTIFCNYDGFNKNRTEIGDNAFIGSNSSLVAPVRIGTGAFVGSGSVITRDVAPDALALERSQQSVREGWAAKFRAMMSRKKNG